MKILVTGSSGFLGSNLISRLKKSEYKVINYDLHSYPLEKLSNIKLLMEKIKGIDAVYHLAGIKDSTSSELYRVNILETRNLINAIRLYAPKAHLIFTSTFAVYKIPSRGQMVDEDFPIVPRNEYGRSKLKAEKEIENISKKFGVRSTILRISNIYGPSKVLVKNSVIADFIDKIMKNEEIEIEGNGRQTRDFIFVDDVVSALVCALSTDKSFGVYNIASGEEVSIIELVSKIEKIFGKKAKVTFIIQNNQSGFWRGSIESAEKHLSWKPKIFLEDGLVKIREYINEKN